MGIDVFTPRPGFSRTMAGMVLAVGCAAICLPVNVSATTLVEEIVKNSTLMRANLNNCPAVPVEIGHALYGSTQDDVDAFIKKREAAKRGTTLTSSTANLETELAKAIAFSGSNSETGLWHFLLSPTHHFVVVPWYNHSTPNQGRVYSVFMAYENKYTLAEYVKKSGGTAPTTKGYRTMWTAEELTAMLKSLLKSDTAWQDYFGKVGANKAKSITYWRYKIISMDKAVNNVKKYKGLR